MALSWSSELLLFSTIWLCHPKMWFISDRGTSSFLKKSSTPHIFSLSCFAKYVL